MASRKKSDPSPAATPPNPGEQSAQTLWDPQSVIPGEIWLAEDPIQANVGRTTVTLEVANSGDRPIQVGSHYHFFETNRALQFDRAAAFGMRLNIPSGNAVRFEPGQTHPVTLVALSGKGLVYGFNQLTEGSIRSPYQRQHSLKTCQDWQQNGLL